MMLNDEHLAVLQFPDKTIGAVARRTRAHDGDDGVSQETDPDCVILIHRDGTAFPGPFRTHHASLHETCCGYVPAFNFSGFETGSIEAVADSFWSRAAQRRWYRLSQREITARTLK